MARLAIFGSGGFGREVMSLASRQAGPKVVFVSDHPSGDVLGSKVIQPADLQPEDRLVIAVGAPADRKAIATRLDKPAHTLIASTALIGPGVEIGEGSIFCDWTMVTASARIGRHFHCNIYSYVAHDCVIGDFVTFAPRVCCNGNVKIGDGAYIGTGAMLMPGISVGSGAIVGMGAVVVKDVAPGTTVFGNPAVPRR